MEDTTGRPRCRWDGNIRMDLREIGWEDIDNLEGSTWG
jgi:hypothetical protein